MAPRPRVEIHLDPSALHSALCREAGEGLRRRPKQLSPKWLYDNRGSELFEEITALAEYYPTRREREILEARAAKVASLSQADTLVELGSGSSAKTRLLLDAFGATGQLRRFVPFDVSEVALRSSATAIANDYPGLDVQAIVGDLDEHLGAIPGGGRRLIVFLGGTIGNFPPAPRAKLLSALAASLAPGDSLLLGTDLVKEVSRMEGAYNDPRGVTAAFNLNLLEVLNRELVADFEVCRFDHVARFDPENSWMEMRLRSATDQRVTLAAIGLEATFADGEEMLTEISAKFEREQVRSELEAVGLELASWWTDGAGDFGLSLSFAA